jgi:hypothetical protein
MKTQRPLRDTLCSQKEFPLSDVGTHRIDYLVRGEVRVALKAVEVFHKIYEAQLLTYLRALDKRVGLLINYNVTRLKEGIKRLIQERTQKLPVGRVMSYECWSLLTLELLDSKLINSVCSVVNFLTIRPAVWRGVYGKPQRYSHACFG